MDLAVISVAGGTSVPFTVGQALRQGHVPFGSTVSADVPHFQSVIKNRWPDGSAKFVILSGRADLSANTWHTIGLNVGRPGQPARWQCPPPHAARRGQSAPWRRPQRSRRTRIRCAPSSYPTEPTAYWGNLMPAISYAVDQGAAGAVAAWNRIASASNFATQVAGYDDTPVWGVKPRTR